MCQDVAEKQLRLLYLSKTSLTFLNNSSGKIGLKVVVRRGGRFFYLTPLLRIIMVA